MLLAVKLLVAAVPGLDLALIAVLITIQPLPQPAVASELIAAYCRLLPNFVIPSLHAGLTFSLVGF